MKLILELLGKLFEVAGWFLGSLVLGCIVFWAGVTSILVYAYAGMACSMLFKGRKEKIVSWRVALAIALAVGLFLIRWYAPLAAAALVLAGVPLFVWEKETLRAGRRVRHLAAREERRQRRRAGLPNRRTAG
jgi:hypothetical protein